MQTGQGHLTPNDAFATPSVVRYGKAQQGDWLQSFLNLPNWIQTITNKFNLYPKNVATGTAQVRLHRPWTCVDALLLTTHPLSRVSLWICQIASVKFQVSS